MPLEIKRNKATGYLYIEDEQGLTHTGVDGIYTTYAQANSAIARYLASQPKPAVARKTKENKHNGETTTGS